MSSSSSGYDKPLSCDEPQHHNDRVMVTPLSRALKLLVRIETAIQLAGGWIAGSLLGTLLLLVTYSYISRIMGWTSSFSEEFSRYTITAIFAFSVGYSALKGKHVSTDFAVKNLTVERQRVVAVLIDVINLITFSLFAYSAATLWQLSYRWNMKSNTDIAFPLWIVQGIFMAGFIFLILRAISSLASHLIVDADGQRQGETK